MSYYGYDNFYLPYDTKPLTAKDVQDILKGWVIGSDQVEEGSIEYFHLGKGSIGEVHIREASINHAHIQNLAVGRGHIQHLAVGTAQIDDLAVTNAKIKDLDASKITTGYLDADRIKANSLTADHIDVSTIIIGEANIEDASIKSAHIGEAQILRTHIGEAEIDRTHIMHGEIITAHIAEGSITSALIGDAQIGTAHIQEGAITTALIGTGAIGTAQIADGSITDAKIVELTANKITAGVLDVERLRIVGEGSILYEINVNSVGELNASEYTLDGGAITERSITADKIVADSITAREIASRTITANEIAVNTITADSGILANASITSAHIADASITNAHIDSIDASKITTGVLDAKRIYVGKESFFEEGYDPTKIQIGGRNLITLNSISSTAPEQMEMVDYKITLTKDNTTNPNVRIPHTLFENDTEYVITFKARKVSGDVYRLAGHSTLARHETVRLFIDGIEQTHKLTNGWSNVGTANFPNDNEVHHYEIRFKTVSDVASVSTPYWYIQPNRPQYDSDSFVLEIWDWKLEKGNKATDWTPAPEDNPAELWRYQDTTYIDGGKIYADTITANAIKGGSFEGKTFTGGRFEGQEILGSIIEGQTEIRIADTPNYFDPNFTDRVSLTQGHIKLESKTFYGNSARVAISGYGMEINSTQTEYLLAPPPEFRVKSGTTRYTANLIQSIGGEQSPLYIFSNLVGIGSTAGAGGTLKVGTIVGGAFSDALYLDSPNLHITRRNIHFGESPSFINPRITGFTSDAISVSAGRTGGSLPYIYLGYHGGDESRSMRSGVGYIPHRASSFPSGSLEKYKTDIHFWDVDILDIYRNHMEIQEYYLKSEVSQGKYRKRQGLVIGEGYKTPLGLIDGDGIDTYQFNSWNAKAIQELITEVDTLKAEIKELKKYAL